MKILLATAALAAAIASPALAQTRVTVPYQYGYDNGSYGSVNQSARYGRSANPANDVYDTRGNYVGSDPDPFIRDDLARTRGH
jgi:hypothetical protein